MYLTEWSDKEDKASLKPLLASIWATLMFHKATCNAAAIEYFNSRIVAKCHKLHLFYMFWQTRLFLPSRFYDSDHSIIWQWFVPEHVWKIQFWLNFKKIIECSRTCGMSWKMYFDTKYRYMLNNLKQWPKKYYISLKHPGSVLPSPNPEWQRCPSGLTRHILHCAMLVPVATCCVVVSRFSWSVSHSHPRSKLLQLKTALILSDISTLCQPYKKYIHEVNWPHMPNSISCIQYSPVYIMIRILNTHVEFISSFYKTHQVWYRIC